ncbi:MAG: hypothetical protein OSA40_10675 [Phycisphaerales bacterium]|nr:hypothetical protein [Phycisphaerales bacterium]
MSARSARRLHPTLLLATLATVVLTICGGCYKRVVGVKNAPGFTGEVHRANVDSGNENLFQIKKRTYIGTENVE